MKKIRINNWEKYAFEFLSIFIAVIAAFALDNWNENRKERIAESKILEEIYDGLEKDIVDLKLNIKGHEMGIHAVKYFRDVIMNNPVSQDSVLQHYLNLTRDFISIQNTSGYETLKSRGLELIENDSLRRKIVSLYEYSYNTMRKLEEEYYELQFQKNYFKEINQSIAPNLEFEKTNPLIRINIPLKIDANKRKELLIYLWKIQTNRIFILQNYSEVEKVIEDLRVEIKKEID